MILCVFGESCIAFDPTVQAPALAVRGPLCDPCLDVASRDINALVLDYRDLEQRLPAGGSILSTRVSGGATDASTPLNLHVEELQAAIAWTLTAWEPPVREAARLPPERVDRVRSGWAVATAVRVIGPRVDVLAALPLTCGFADGLAAGPVERDGVDAVASLIGLHRRARSMLGLTTRVVRLPGACLDCGAAALERADGADAVGCAVCGQWRTGEEYRRYVAMAVGSVQDRRRRPDKGGCTDDPAPAMSETLTGALRGFSIG